MVVSENWKLQFYPSFCTSNLSLCAKGLPRQLGNRNFTSIFAFRTSHLMQKGCIWELESATLPHFLHIEPFILCERVAATTWKSQFYPSFCTSNLILCEGVAEQLGNRNFTPIFAHRIMSCERVAPESWKAQFYPSFAHRRSFRAKGLHLRIGNRNFTTAMVHRTSFRAKGLPGQLGNCNFTLVFAHRTSLGVKGLRLATRSLAAPPPEKEFHRTWEV